MPEAYAYRILGFAIGMSALGLGGVLVASMIYDRNTRRIEAATHARKAD